MWRAQLRFLLMLLTTAGLLRYAHNSSVSHEISVERAALMTGLSNCCCSYSRLCWNGPVPIPVCLDGLGSPGKERDATSQGQLQQQQQPKQRESGRHYRREDYTLPVNLFSGIRDHRDAEDRPFQAAGRETAPERTGCTGCCEVVGPGGESTRLRSGCQLEAQ